MTLFSGVIKGAPRTKKNHNRRVWRGGRANPKQYTVPSLAYEDWDKYAVLQLNQMTQAKGIAVEVNCKAIFFRDALTGDACGYYQGLADTLQHAGVVLNDCLIVSWDGSRLWKDAQAPRVEFELTKAEGPSWMTIERSITRGKRKRSVASAAAV